MDLLNTIETKKNEILRIYQDLHAIPEKGWHELKTSQYLKEALEKADFEVTANVGGTTGVRYMASI